MKTSNLFLILALFAIQFTVGAQNLGNEWINHNQQYYKVKVAKNGIYRVTQNALQSAGAPVSSIDPRTIKVFYRGEEQHIRVEGEGNGIFEPGDFIEFFGSYNDGMLDRQLYRDPNKQPHPYYSFYTDTSTYFITWGDNQSTRRITVIDDNNFSNQVKEDYYIREVLDIQKTMYHDGFLELVAPPDIRGYLGNSYYTEGEGWGSNLFGQWQPAITRNLSTNNFYAGGPAPFVEFLIHGRNDAPSTDPNGYNHHVEIATNPGGGAFSVLLTHKYKGFQSNLLTTTIPTSQIGATSTNFRFRHLGDLGQNHDLNSLSYIRLLYPSTFELNQNSILDFNLTGFKGNVSYLELTGYNTSKNSPLFYDITNNLLYKGYIGNNPNRIVQVKINGGGTDKRMFLTDETDIQELSPKRVEFVNFENLVSGKGKFLIITSKRLEQSAQQYHDYRQTTGHEPVIVFTEDLYNSFSYGQHHVLALRNFAKSLIANDLEPAYVLLLGKGYQMNLLRQGTVLAEDHVPVMGFPPSDNLTFAGINGPELTIPFPLGRIPARNNSEVLNYLNKLIAYEANGNELWRKNVLHMSGGRNYDEHIEFSRNLALQERIIADTSLGASIKTISKTDPLPINTTLKQSIVNHLNSGVGFTNYFGHGAADVLEIDIGDPHEFGQNGKSPFMYFTGCILGNSYTNSSMVKEYVLQNNGGAIGWVATSSWGFVFTEHSFTMEFYRQLSSKSYGQSAAAQLRNTILAWNNPSSALNAMKSLQTTFHGDPALKIYSPELPDYLVRENNISIYPENASAQSDSFALAIIINNQGKAINDSFEVRVTRTFPDNSSMLYPFQRVSAPYNTDTVYFWIQNNKQLSRGLNKFEVYVDAGFEIHELDENNNSGILEHFFLASGAQALLPPNYGIVPQREVELVAQITDLLSGNSEFIFEIDTTKHFNSPWKKSSGPITSTALAKWNTNLLHNDSLVYYWRVKLEPKDGENSVWNNHSFTYIANSPTGYAQFDFPQFDNIISNTLLADTLNRIFDFSRITSVVYSVGSAGSFHDASKSQFHRWVTEDHWKMTWANINNGMAFVAINPDNLRRLNYPHPYNFPAAPIPFYDNSGFSGVFAFNWVSAQGGSFNLNNSIVDSFIKYYENIPNDYYVIAYTGVNHLLDQMPESVHEMFDNLGLLKSRVVPNGHPYIFIGQKGSSPGSAVEVTADPSSGIPPTEQIITASSLFYPRRTEGELTSGIIGPSANWQEFYYTYEIDNPQDSIYMTIHGIDNSGNRTLLFNKFTETSKDLFSIDASQYPYLQISALLKDDSLRTAPQIKKWAVLYEYMPEGIINHALAYHFYADTLDAGDSLQIKLAFQNISDFKMDSILVKYEIFNSNRDITISGYERLAAIDKDEHVVFQKSFPTLQMHGVHDLRVTFNPDHDQPEMYLFNNFYRTPFYVKQDQFNPLVDVTFDGNKIFNGDLVSPSPHIQITLRDENRFKLLSDTSVFEIYLKHPNQEEAERISFDRHDITFVPATNSDNNQATVHFNPQQLADGIYELQVNARDAVGNPSGRESYKIQFEVDNRSAITHFYPYPNPFTTQMKFVYTLSGSEIPDHIKVQIMNISGRVVKEINLLDFGPVRAGNNITDYCWDGTDEFGNKLANGVYFYKVYTFKNGQPMERRDSGNNNEANLFKRDIGKITILR